MPILNDGARVIPAICTLAFTVNYSFELIVVYDLDDDTTLPFLKVLQNKFDFIRLEKNTGKRVIGALQTGFDAAKSEIVGIWLPYHVDPFGLINKMYEKMVHENCVVVSGNRFNKVKRISRGSTLKKLLSRGGNYLLNRFIGIPFGDITTSIKLYRIDFIKNTPIETKISGGWSFNTELAVKAAIKGVKLGEVEFLPENTNIITGVSNFKVFKQLDYYLKWLLLGFKNRKIITKNYSRNYFKNENR